MTSLVVVAGVLLGSAVAGWRLRGWLRRRGGLRAVARTWAGHAPEDHYRQAASFARIVPVSLRGPEADLRNLHQRVVLGMKNGRAILGQPWLPISVIGGTNSGKTSSILIPAVLEWDGAAVVASVKADLLRATIAARQRLGPVVVYDPSGLLVNGEFDDLQGVRAVSKPWTPLAACLVDGKPHWKSCRRMGDAMVHGGATQPGGDPYWGSMAAQLIALCLYVVVLEHGKGATMLHVLESVLEANSDQGATRLADKGAATQSKVIQLLTGTIPNQPPNMRGSVVGTAQAALDVYTYDDVSDAPVDDCLDPRCVVESRATLYMVATTDEQELYRPLFTALMAEIVAKATATAGAKRTGALSVPLLLAIDEAANVAPVPELDQHVTTSRSAHIQWLLAWQTKAQVEARYGKLAASTILSNSPSLVLLPNIRDPETMQWAEDIFGDYLEEYETASVTETSSVNDSDGSSPKSRSRSRSRSTNVHRERVRLLPKGQLATMGEGYSALLIGQHRIIAEQRRYYQVPQLTAAADVAYVPPTPSHRLPPLRPD